MHCIKYKSNSLKYFSIQEMIVQDEEETSNILDEIANHFCFEQKVIIFELQIPAYKTK